MSKTINVSKGEAIALAKEYSITLADLQQMGFAIEVAGQANVTAAEAAPQVNEELVAMIEALWAAGRTKDANGKRLANRDGRWKSVLGRSEQIGDFRVAISAPKGYKPAGS